MENKNMTKCKACGADIAKGVKKCPHCGQDQRNFFMKHKVISIILALIIIGSISSALNGNDSTTTNTAQQSTSDSTKTKDTSDKATTNSTDSVKEKPAVKQRQVAGAAIDLSAGTFTGGKDIPVGLYDATSVEGQGNFTVNGSDGSLKINEILGAANGMGVSKVRVEVVEGDKIQLQSINKAHFEPVTTPFVTKAQQLSLYSGVWKAGEDIAVGRYKAVPVNGSGNFVVYDKSNMPKVNEILGGDAGGVKEVTFDIKDGEIINIASLNQVNITPVN